MKKNSLVDGQEKMCSKCGEIKHIHVDFAKTTSAKDGRSSQCKSCVSKYQKELRDRKKHGAFVRRQRTHSNGNGLEKFIFQEGLVALMNHARAVFLKTKDEFLSSFTSPQREGANKFLEKIFESGLDTLVKEASPNCEIYLKEIEKLKKELKNKDDVIARKDAVIEMDREWINKNR